MDNDNQRKNVQAAARVLYELFDAVEKLVLHVNDPEMTAWWEEERNYVKPQLDWAVRYGNFFGSSEDADDDTEPGMPGF